jgi:hypothetical protein
MSNSVKASGARLEIVDLHELAAALAGAMFHLDDKDVGRGQ